MYFQITRLAIIFWCMVMISSIESIGIRTEGQVELESTNKETYAKVLTLAVGPFLGDAAFKVAKSRKKDEKRNM